jgi:hypothetical protein
MIKNMGFHLQTALWTLKTYRIFDSWEGAILFYSDCLGSDKISVPYRHLDQCGTLGKIDRPLSLDNRLGRRRQEPVDLGLRKLIPKFENIIISKGTRAKQSQKGKGNQAFHGFFLI